MTKILVGKTYKENEFGMMINELIEVYQCSECSARDYDKEDCYYCRKMINDFHADEAKVGII
jgi:hypothetical protein